MILYGLNGKSFVWARGRVLLCELEGKGDFVWATGKVVLYGLEGRGDFVRARGEGCFCMI